MVTPILETPPAVPASSGTIAYLAKLLSGPVAFAIVLAWPLPLPHQGHMALATFACVVVTFTYMLMVGTVSMFISDAATVAMMMPIGMSLEPHLRGSMPGALSIARFL